MKFTVLFLALLATSANAQTVSDADLAKAYAACRPHRSLFVSRTIPTWESGWEHCAAVEEETENRKAEKEKSADFSKSIAGQLRKNQ